MEKIKQLIVKILKFIYRHIPLKLETKQKIKNKIAKRFKFIRRISNYNDRIVIQKNTIFSNDIKLAETEKLDKLNKKIAVHLHLYYVDLSEEFIKYLNNIPYKFDLLISIQENQEKESIVEKFKEIKNVEKIDVRHTKNIGRDFSPMFIVFKNTIEKYDYLLHMHSKKSIRTGTQQDGWRQHMIKGVLGNEENIEKIFYQFEKGNNIGMIYPETYYDMPYWAHTWLKNTDMSSKIANKLGFKISDEYIDYSVGSFFWVKVPAIKKFLDLNYTWNDFGEEQGKADGTLAHAIERMITQVVTASGYNYLTIDNNQNVFHCKGVKNLYQYNEKTKQQCIDELMQYDIITFDIFDTLISRKTISPSTIFDILEKNVEKKYKIENFKTLRQNAEYNVRVEKNFIGDCSIDEIYSNLEKTISLEKKEIEKIKEMEIELEIKFAIPRRDMLEIFNHLVDNNKKIILISDMYLTSEIIEKMLNKCGYKGWNKLLVSSEVGLRKDNGTIWDYYFNDIAKDKKTIHVGDNEQSDVQQLCDLGKPFYHVMQAKKMFQLSDYSIYTNNNCNILTTNDKIVQGLIINNCLYNSPFKKTDEEIINNFHDFGYSIFGPIFIKYMNFLQKNMIENKYNKILFLAREGYYLQKIYKKYCSIFNQKEIKNYYFYTSRRATSVACIENKEDAKQILSTGYEGNLRNLFKNRLGIEDKNIDDIFVKTSENMDKINETLENIYGNHKKQFEQEKKEYLKYCKKYISKQEKIAISDLGYSGTIQYYLMKLLDKKMDGYYFTLSDNLKPEKIGGKCYGCFDSKKENIEKNIFLFSMILETFLTAPYGQLIKMEKDKPVYRDENIDEELIKNLDEIYEGIVDFMNDISGISENILDFEISNEFICSNFSSLVYVDEVLSQKIKKIFVLDNSYSLDGKINVFDYFNIVYRKNR